MAYRVFELTSLEQLIRSQHKAQIRRPLILDAFEQSPQHKESFMRMFRGSDHSPSPPPTFAPRRKGSAASTFSSLAAGKASIVREDTDKTSQKAFGGEADDAEEETETDALTVAASDLPEGSGFTVLTTDERLSGKSTVAIATREAAEVAMAVVVGEDLDAGDAYSDLLVLEDRNGTAERMKDPLMKFESLLNRNKTSGMELSSNAPKSRRFGISSGLKSPNEVYFSNSVSCPLFPISKADLALYARYASASTSVFEHHNLLRQRKPTVWKLPTPLSRIRKPNARDNSSSPTHRLSFRQKKGEEEQPKQKASSIKRILPSMGRMPPQSPFRKDFSKLGPMFQFKPPLFTVDSTYETELSALSEESIRLYRETVEMRTIMTAKKPLLAAERTDHFDNGLVGGVVASDGDGLRWRHSKYVHLQHSANAFHAAFSSPASSPSRFCPIVVNLGRVLTIPLPVSTRSTSSSALEGRRVKMEKLSDFEAQLPFDSSRNSLRFHSSNVSAPSELFELFEQFTNSSVGSITEPRRFCPKHFPLRTSCQPHSDGPMEPQQCQRGPFAVPPLSPILAELAAHRHPFRLFNMKKGISEAVPDSALLIVLGLVLGWVLRMLDVDGESTDFLFVPSSSDHFRRRLLHAQPPAVRQLRFCAVVCPRWHRLEHNGHWYVFRVVVQCALLNRFRTKKFSFSDQFVLSYGGLRGAIAFGLVVSLDDSLPPKQMFVTTCISVIFFTVFFQGITIRPLLHWLKVKKNDLDKEGTVFEKLCSRNCDYLMAGIEDIVGLKGRNSIRETFERFNANVLKPALMRGEQHKPYDASPIIRAYNKLTLLEAQRLVRASLRKTQRNVPIGHRVGPAPSPSSATSTLTYFQWTTEGRDPPKGEKQQTTPEGVTQPRNAKPGQPGSADALFEIFTRLMDEGADLGTSADKLEEDDIKDNYMDTIMSNTDGQPNRERPNPTTGTEPRRRRSLSPELERQMCCSSPSVVARAETRLDQFTLKQLKCNQQNGTRSPVEETKAI
uniref:Na_H_Exchanger domain-containing protein n=1 Tax=Globodera pallida TaxID=36090 RepID=A0A183CHA7_GLOPA